MWVAVFVGARSGAGHTGGGGGAPAEEQPVRGGEDVPPGADGKSSEGRSHGLWVPAAFSRWGRGKRPEWETSEHQEEKPRGGHILSLPSGEHHKKGVL